MLFAIYKTDNENDKLGAQNGFVYKSDSAIFV